MIKCTALLYLTILRSFRYEFSHVERRCGHVSLSFLWHSVGFWCVRAKIYVSCGYPCIEHI